MSPNTVYVVLLHVGAAARNDYRPSTSIVGVYADAEVARAKVKELTNIQRGEIATSHEHVVQ